MKPPLTSACHYLGSTKKSPAQISKSVKSGKSPARFARYAVVLVFLALATSAFYSSSAASSSPHGFALGNMARSLSSNPLIKAVINSRAASAAVLSVEQGGALESRFPAVERYFPLAALPQATVPESITLYAPDNMGNCATPSTPKSDFKLGEKVCAQVLGIPMGAVRRINWQDPSGYVEKSTIIVADGQTDHWTNPALAAGLVAGTFVVENRGTWRVNITTTSGALRASAFYTVKDSDPNITAADLSVNISALGDDSPTAGSQVQYLIRVANQGPNAAAGVHLVDSDFVNATLNSVTQSGGTGNAFTCTSTSGVDCQIASLPAGAAAEFLVNFTAGAAGSTIDNKATITSTTTELNATDNTSFAQPLRVNTGGAPAACVLECPNNITVLANTTQNNVSGAIVTYGSPEAFGSCGAVSTVAGTPASGSFFPVGSTVIAWTSAQGGGSCSFTITVDDTAPPVISCPANQTVDAADGECSAVVDPGTATTVPADQPGVNISGQRSDGQALNASYPAGTTTITWTATDQNGRSSTCTQTITVNASDTTPPTIVAPPDVVRTTGATEEAACGVIISETALTPEANDNCSVTVSRTGVPAGNFFPIGTTTVTYTATDAAGLTATAQQTITVSDNTPPVVTPVGDDPTTPENEAPDITVECGTAYTDPGATAVDSCTGPASVTATTVSTDTPGTYTIIYSATDGANTGTSTRTVHVVDTTAPVIALNGANPLQVECHSTFTDPGATANDGCAGSFAADASGNVNTDVPGTYTITYTATDPSGNAATPVTRTVNVVDTLAPVITVNGANPFTVECHTSFVDPGATAVDACNGPVGVVASGSVNVDVPGSYTITYTATDGARSSTATRTVNVVDTTAPVISCPANIVVSLPLNSSAVSMPVSYPAPTATDSCASNVTVTTTKASGSVFDVGTTLVTATATDPAGNSSSCSFTVTVLYNFTGFLQPVDNLPTLNQVNAGKAIPVKFSLSGNKGLGIFAPNSPSSGIIQCGANDPVVDLEETVTAGGSSISYSATSDQYNYIWKTDSAWAGTCRQLIVQLNDGSIHRANFKFK